jgi:Zn-dependent protease
MDWVADVSAWIIPLVLAITLHEAAHGWMADRFGDDTARLLGRVTFNPVKHIDRMGTIILPGLLMLAHSPFLFGYAKPVPVNFARLRPLRLGMFMVAFAGPGTNIVLALASGLLLHVDAFVTPEQAPWLYLNLYRSLTINCVLAVFNMLPILPLDGGRVVDSMLSGSVKRIFGKTERYGIVVVMLIVLIPGALGIGFIRNVISTPTYWLVAHVLYVTGNGSADTTIPDEE